MEKATCYIVDDEILAAERLERLINLNNQIMVIGSNSAPLIALDEICRLRPDLVFLDVEMPVLTGFELLDKIRCKGFSPEIVMVTAFDQYAIRAIRADAMDYLVKPVDVDDLNTAIKHFCKKKSQTVHIPDDWKLTGREKQVLQLLAHGLSSKEIAENICLSRHTIDSYRRSILEKSGYKTTGELIALLRI